MRIYKEFLPHTVSYVALVTGPAVLAVSLSDVKTHLKVSGSSEDTYLTQLIEAAVEVAEKYTKRDFITKTYRQLQDTFFNVNEVRKSPNVSVTSVKYYDVDNVQQTLSSALYYALNYSQYLGIFPVDNASWPSTYLRPHAVEINFTAGYGSAPSNVPAGIKQALMMMVAYLYENRGDCNACGPADLIKNNTAVRNLLEPFRLVDLVVNSHNVRF